MENIPSGCVIPTESPLFHGSSGSTPTKVFWKAMTAYRLTNKKDILTSMSIMETVKRF